LQKGKQALGEKRKALRTANGIPLIPERGLYENLKGNKPKDFAKYNEGVWETGEGKFRSQKQ